MSSVRSRGPGPARKGPADREPAPASASSRRAWSPTVGGRAWAFFVRHPDVAAALLFALFVFVYLWPVLVGGRILSPIALLYESAPWTELAPADLSSYYNPLLSDVPVAVHPWRSLVRDLLHEGALPAWNPYEFAGAPLYTNPQTGLFSIFSLPLWILPLNYGIGVGAALKLWAGGFGTYLLVRELRLGFLPGLLAGVAFSFSAINIAWLTHETLPAVAVLLPWMLWLIERIFRGGRLGCLLGLAVASAFALGGGHPGMQVHVLAAAAVYALLRAAFLAVGSEVSWREQLRPLGVAFGGLALGALLMAFMLVPEALSSRDTIGTVARDASTSTLPGTEMPLTTIRTTLFPDWWGRPSGVMASNEPVTALGPANDVMVGVNYNERTLYAGVVALLLACVALVAPGAWRRKGPFAALAFLGLAIPLHFPGLYQLVTHLPVLDLVQNQRLHFVWALGVAVLAAFGLQTVLDRPRGDRARLAVGIGALVLGVVALAGAGASGTDVGDVVSHFVSGRDFRSDGVLALTSVAWYLLLAVGVGLALLAARRWPARVTAVGAAIVALAAADMLHFAGDFQPMPRASQAIPPRTGVVRFLEARRDEGRILGLGYTLTNNWSLMYGLRDIRGYDPPQPTARFQRLWSVANPEQPDWTPFTFGGLSEEGVHVASVLGARYIVTEPGAEVASEAGPLVRGLRVVYDGADARVFENPRAAPRVLVPRDVRAVEGEYDAWAAVADPGLDPRRAVVVERAGGNTAGGIAGRQATAGQGSVKVVEESNARVLLRTSLDRAGLVVLNDNDSAGWEVRLDGQPAEERRVNYLMRGVNVGAGVHEVEWRYHVPGLRLGWGLSVAALLALAAGVGMWLRRRRRA